MRAVAFFAFVASAMAYSVSFPSTTEGWTDISQNKLTWNMVSSDRSNFSVFLTNEDRSVMPTNNLVLAALVQGTDGTIDLGEPSAGWPLGSGFRVNLCQDSESPNAILAQSDQFNINASTSSTSSSGSSTTVASQTSITTHSGTTLVASATPTGSETSTSATNAPATTSNAALPVGVAQGGILGALAIVVAALV